MQSDVESDSDGSAGSGKSGRHQTKV